MTRTKNQLIYHSMASRPNTLAIDIEIARSLGFDGLETSGSKIAAFLEAGFSPAELKTRLDGLILPGIGFLIDLERQGDGRRQMLREAEELCALAAAAGAKGIEAITGPLDIRVFEAGAAERYPDLYRGLVDLPTEAQLELTAANLRAVAEIAAASGRPIGYQSVPLADFVAQMRAEGLPDDYVELIRYLFSSVLDGRNSSLTSDIEHLLMRRPRDFATYVRETAATGVWSVAA